MSAATLRLGMTTREELPEPTGPAVNLYDSQGRIQARYYPLLRAVVINDRHKNPVVHRLTQFDQAVDAAEQPC